MRIALRNLRKRSKRFIVVAVLCTALMLLRYKFFWYSRLAESFFLRPTSRSSIGRVTHRCACQNLLTNVTVGHWKLNANAGKADIERLDRLLQNFWRKKKIPVERWRTDNKCGYYNVQVKVPGSSWPRVGSWCDPQSTRPCCDNSMNGTCARASRESCECYQCVDTRKYKHAELSRWVAEDQRCTWNVYDAASACAAIEKSPFDDIYFAGDSFLRNMFFAFLMSTSSDWESAIWSSSANDTLREQCRGATLFFWKPCRKIISNMRESAHFGSICAGKRPSFNASYQYFTKLLHAKQFLNFINQTLGKTGTLILLSVGYHDGSNARAIIKKYIEPSLHAIDRYYASVKDDSLGKRWPRLVFVPPMPQGLLKPTDRLRKHNNEKIDSFTSDMKMYLAKRKIHVLDFRQLAHQVHSFDGTHYGMSVNMMKNQIFFNYLTCLNN